MKTKLVNSIVVTTQELAIEFARKADSDCVDWGIYSEVSRALFTGDITGIRKAFLNGFTVMLLPEEAFNFLVPYLDGKTDEQLTDSIELRIIHNGRTIGVLVDRELQY